MKKLLLILVLLFVFSEVVEGQIKNYCYDTYSGQYVMSLHDDGSGKATYKLFNSSGGLVKTLQGEWSMRDEGLYGPAYVITISWIGANSGLQDLKFTAQFDGNGKLQGIIDSESRVWNYCR